MEQPSEESMITYTLDTKSFMNLLRGKEIDEAFALSAAHLGKTPEGWHAELSESLADWRTK